MSGQLEDRLALVIGATRCIGKGTVKRFLQEGANVVIGDIGDAGQTFKRTTEALLASTA
jgi:NAD(P)-dependent dehydrogenase (short-subunit alcohol dehydrogenase family)